MRRIRIIIALIFMLALVFPVFAFDFKGLTKAAPPEPRLLYPTSDKVVLKGSASLEFKWMREFSDIDHYEFRLYKGYNMYASNLILKQTVSADSDSFKAGSELFQDNQVYTWSLIQVSTAGQKSDRSFNAFTVVK